MSSQNILNPLCSCGEVLGTCGCGGGNTLLIERLIGNAYGVVKYVACKMGIIQALYDYLQANPGGTIGGGGTPLNSINVKIVDNSSAVVEFTPVDSVVQQLTLTQDVTASSIAASTSNPLILTVRIIQDATGGHAFAWPPTIIGHGEISLAANAISQQIFAKNVDGTYDNVTPMMYPRG